MELPEFPNFFLSFWFPLKSDDFIAWEYYTYFIYNVPVSFHVICTTMRSADNWIAI